MKPNVEITYERKYEINYNKTGNYATSEKSNWSIYFIAKTTLYFQKSKLTNYPTLVIELMQSYKENWNTNLRTKCKQILCEECKQTSLTNPI